MLDERFSHPLRQIRGDGKAYAELLRAPLMICELTPMTSPSRLISGPPLLPGLIDASVWMTPPMENSVKP